MSAQRDLARDRSWQHWQECHTPTQPEPELGFALATLVTLGCGLVCVVSLIVGACFGTSRFIRQQLARPGAAALVEAAVMAAIVALLIYDVVRVR